MAVHPAKVQGRKDAGHHAHPIAMQDGMGEGVAAADGDAGEHVGLPLRPDGVMVEDEVPDILHEKVAEASGIAVEKGVGSPQPGGPPLEAAVGGNRANPGLPRGISKGDEAHRFVDSH